MAIGKRIKRFRNMHNLTQKELGAKIGFPFNATDVRIAQYESEKRIPKEEMVKKLANLFGVSPAALTVPDIDSDVGLMHTLFTLEDTRAFRINKIDDTICITLDKSDNLYASMLDMLTAWYEQYEKYQNGEISKEEYDRWRYTYPKMESEQFLQDVKKIKEKKKSE